MDRVEIQVTATIDLTSWIEYLTDDIIEIIDDRFENLIDEEGRFDDKSLLQIEKALVAGVIKGLAKNYLDEDEE